MIQFQLLKEISSNKTEELLLAPSKYSYFLNEKSFIQFKRLLMGGCLVHLILHVIYLIIVMSIRFFFLHLFKKTI